MADPRDFERHTHDKVVHDHEHFHVTHNWSETAGTFMHLSSKHIHSHDHAEVNHAHLPHENFEEEHRGEAHDHDHGEPVKKRAPKKSAKKAAKKAG
jgi:hypothetical protein